MKTKGFIFRSLLLLAFSALIIMLPSCTPSSLNQRPQNPDTYIVKNGESDYKIAYRDSGANTYFEEMAENFANNSYVYYDKELEIYEASDNESQYEVLLGATNRPLSAELVDAVDAAGKREGDYAWGYAYKDGCLAFYANSQIAAELGFAELTELCFKDDGIAVPENLFTVNTKSRAQYEEENKKEPPNADIPTGEPSSTVISQNSSLIALCPLASVGISGTIQGESSSYILTLPSKIVLNGDLKITNVTLSGDCTIIANGYTLEIAESVEMPQGSGRLTVFGGTESGTLNGDTNLILLGARYLYIYGGGKGAAVNGNTNIVLGGNANSGESIDDASSNFSGCKLYGGGQSASVSGSTNITLKDHAVAKYIVGTGTSAVGAQVKATNIHIEGGKVMNLIGASENSPASGITVNITVTGGLIESIFGGCQAQPMTGDVNITLLGGDISRRVYAGCYNNYGFWDGFTTTYSVNGTLTVTIGPDARLASGKELSSDNDSDTGIFVSSRIPARASGERGIVIFLDGCYASQKYNLGSTGWISASPDSFHLYEIDCQANGCVYGYSSTQISIIPDFGYKCTLDENIYLHAEDKSQNLYTLPPASSVTKITVTFTKE